MSTTSNVIPLNLWVPDMTFGERLAHVRKAYGRKVVGRRVTQAAFAELIGINEKTLAAYEVDTNTPSLEQMEEIAYAIQRATGIAAWHVLGMTEHNGGPGGQNTPVITDGLSFACTRSALAPVYTLSQRAA
jgi:DNA-binding XRE family transcriptional regulator